MYPSILRYIAVIALATLPLAARAQTTASCPIDNCHIVPYFKGEGGFVAALEPQADSATALITCANLTITLDLAPRGDGIVAALFNHNNGLACDAPNAALEITNLAPGGWFWIHDDLHSAVGPLLTKEFVLTAAHGGAIDLTPPIDPGGVELSHGDAITFLRDPRSGRVGLLGHYTPQLPLPLCTGSDPGTGCRLVGNYDIRLRVGSTDQYYLPGATILRNHGERISLNAQATGTGWITASTTHTLPSRSNLTFSLNGSAGATTVDTPGVTQNENFTYSIYVGEVGTAADTHCAPSNPTRGVPVAFYITALPDNNWAIAPEPDSIGPTLFYAACSSAAGAAANNELVPPNPFPVDP